MDVTIRIDHIDDTVPKRLISFLESYPKALVYEEVSDETKKLHYQGWIQVEDDKAYNAMKVRFSTSFKSHTKGQKSMAKVKKESYKSYICKDGKQFYRKGVTDEELVELEKNSYKKSDKKKTVQTGFQKALDYVKDNGCNASTDGWQIYAKLTDYYLEQVKCEPNEYQLGNMTKSIAKHLMYEKCVELNRMEAYNHYIKDRAMQALGCTWIQPSTYFDKLTLKNIISDKSIKEDGISQTSNDEA